VIALLLRGLYPKWSRAEAAVRVLRGLAIAAGVVAAILLACFALLTLMPLDTMGLATPRTAGPAMSHEQAIATFEAVRSAEDRLPLNPRCKSRLLTHGSRTAEAIVFLHGLTNCPAQADELAPKLFALGYNVYVPRLPGHGEVDQMTEALVPLTSTDYVEATEQAIEIGRGLGDKVVVTGLSAGGALTMWSAQYRGDVEHTVAVAPFLAPNMVPSWASRAATNLLLILPNMMFTWNPLEPLGPPDMDYAYPRVPTRALAQFMRIGEIVAASARTTPPAAHGLGVMVNEADFAVNNALAKMVAKSWERQGREVDLKILPVSARLLHDLIDPRQAEANTDLAYGLLVEMLERRPGR
jgi:esterase/lipase